MPYFMFSQNQENRSSYGVYLGYGLNSHDADFKRLPDCPNCSPGYKSGDGSGLNFGLVFDYPIDNSFYLSSKLLYKNLSGKLLSTEKTTIIAEGIPTEGEFEHSLEATLGVIGFEPSVKVNLLDKLMLNIGFNVSYLLTKDYSQVEKITKPTDFGTFLNPDGSDSFSRKRNKFSGTLQEANSLYLAPTVSLSYQLPIDKRGELFLEPEVSYHLGISNIVNDDLVNKWAVSSLTFGISLKYSPTKSIPKKEINIEEFNIDTIKIEKDIITSNFSTGVESVQVDLIETDIEIIKKKITTRTDTMFTQKAYTIDGTLTALGVDAKGNEIPNPKFVVEEFVSNRLDPLLNYIFFDDNSSQLPERYIKINKNETKDFNINNLFRDSTLQLYYNILNIIGKRLTENPSANITLIGCNSDLEKEKGNINLSNERNFIVKNYLTNIWNISEGRIKLQSRNLPEKASTPKTEPDKIAENRRVEIYSDNPKILEPIFIEKVDRSANPPIVRFKLDAKSDLPLSKWELKSYQEINPNNVFNKQGKTLINQIDWVLSTDQKIIPQYEEIHKSELVIEDEKNNRKNIKGNDLKIEIKTIQEKRREMQGDYEIERFSLILFDFDKATIEGSNKNIIDFIKSRIKDNSEIEILGYADRTGNLEYNQKLAERRAIATQKAIGRIDAKAIGIGSSQLLYNNDIPEGRFYCRTVNIVVKTKVK